MDKSLKNVFRVPRKTNKQILELITDDGDQKQFLLTKLMESFKKPEVSKSSMQFHQCWSIKNPESETIYAKKRQFFKQKNLNITEYYGFLYIKTEKDLSYLSTFGKLKIGNLPDSKLADGKMGVSLSQFSDVFHPGTSNLYVPTKGILLIVKYMKGKVNYVTYDEHPMEPQPQFDCHIVRNGNNLESNTALNKAFHSTQIFLYEYTEDADIVDYPSQLLIIGAASFTWSKKYIFKTPSEKPTIVQKVPNKRPLPESFTHDDPIPHKFSCLSSFSKIVKPKFPNEPVAIMSGNLVIKDIDSAQIQINVTLTSKFKEPFPLHNLIVPAWEMTEVIPNKIFTEFFLYMDDKGTPSNVKISQDKVTQLPPKFYEGKVVPREGRLKHMIYLSMVPSSFRDKKDMTKLIDHMSKLETVGRVTTPFFPNVLFFIFPSGKISENFGIPKDDGAVLHVLLLYIVHPEIGSSNVLLKDEYTFIVQTNMFYIQKEMETKPLITLQTLQETALKQMASLKDLYGKLSLKSHSSTTKSSTPDVSDMEIDSETETESSKKSIQKKPQPLIQKSPKEPPKGLPPSKLVNCTKETPIRTPITLPDTICFDSINWKPLPSPISESEKSDLSSVGENNRRSRVEVSEKEDQSTLNVDQNVIQTKANVDQHIPSHNHIPAHFQQPNVPSSHLHAHQLSPSQIPLPQHPPSATPQSHTQISNHCPPTSSTTVAILQRPSQSNDHQTNCQPVPFQPKGYLKLISMTRQNNFISRRNQPPNPIYVRNLELMPDSAFISVYKG